MKSAASGSIKKDSKNPAKATIANVKRQSGQFTLFTQQLPQLIAQLHQLTQLLSFESCMVYKSSSE